MRDLVQKYSSELLLGLVGVVCVALGWFWWQTSSTYSNKVEIIPPTVDQKTITVDIAGAVTSPGVYRLVTGDRIQNLIDKAGGFSSQADREWIAKSLNQAQKLTDGQKLYIPKIGESSVLKSGKININAATLGELDSLAGIGPTTAAKIIAGRPYQQLTELVTRKLVSTKVFDQIKDQVSLW